MKFYVNLYFIGVFLSDTAQKVKFSIKDFFSKYDQTRSFSQIWSHLLKKSLIKNFIFCAARYKSIKKTFSQTWLVLRLDNYFLIPKKDTAFIYIRKRLLNITVFNLCMMRVLFFFCFVFNFLWWDLNWFDMFILELLVFNWFYK